MNNKFQEIISAPAMIVPTMTTEEINLTLLDASVQYIKKNITLETFTLLAAKMQQFMGMRGENSTQIDNMLSEIVNFKTNKNTARSINSMLLESVDQSLINVHVG